MRKALFDTSIVLFALVLLNACGDDSSNGACGPANCPGCCDPNTGICQAGNHVTNCGTGGNVCLTCTDGTACNATTGQCEQNSQICMPSNCPSGCCDSAGRCVQPGNLNYACGTGGALCKACTGSQQCVNGTCSDFNPQACTAQNCATGCCYGDQCQPNPNASQCGLYGSPCVSCPANYTCNAQTGQCQDPSGCGAPCQQANGCCANNQCQPGNHPMACGSGGQTCDTCTQDEVCRDQQCQPAVDPGSCTPFNCPTGCCDNTGRCHIDGVINEQYCGGLGLQCETCQTWEECSLGSCKPKSGSCNCPNGCCDGTVCVLYAQQNNNLCGSGGATCKACTGGSSCNTTTGTCTSTGTGQYRTCVVSVTFNCNNYTDCQNDPDPLLYVTLGLSTDDYLDESTRQSFTVSSVDQTLTFNWCGPDIDALSDILAGIKLKVWEEDDTWNPFDLLDNTLAECTLMPPQSTVTDGTQWTTACGSVTVTLRFQP